MWKALEREIERAEQEAARDAYRMAQADYVDALRRAPLLVKETSISLPPTSLGKSPTCHQTSRLMSIGAGWTDTAGTVNPWAKE